METPLTPLEFVLRARKLHAAREAVVDGDLRLTYAQFGDRWSAALVKLGVRQGDRVGTIAPNTHQHLEQFYAIPQIGAVIVPMSFRLTAEDFVYLANHSGCKVLCVHPAFMDSVDRVRERMTEVEHFVALEEPRQAGSTTKRCSRRATARSSAPRSPRPISSPSTTRAVPLQIRRA